MPEYGDWGGGRQGLHSVYEVERLPEAEREKTLADVIAKKDVETARLLADGIRYFAADDVTRATRLVEAFPNVGAKVLLAAGERHVDKRTNPERWRGDRPKMELVEERFPLEADKIMLTVLDFALPKKEPRAAEGNESVDDEDGGDDDGYGDYGEYGDYDSSAWESGRYYPPKSEKQEALEVLQEAVGRYPEHADLVARELVSRAGSRDVSLKDWQFKGLGQDIADLYVHEITSYAEVAHRYGRRGPSAVVAEGLAECLSKFSDLSGEPAKLIKTYKPKDAFYGLDHFALPEREGIVHRAIEEFLRQDIATTMSGRGYGNIRVWDFSLIVKRLSELPVMGADCVVRLQQYLNKGTVRYYDDRSRLRQLEDELEKVVVASIAKIPENDRGFVVAQFLRNMDYQEQREAMKAFPPELAYLNEIIYVISGDDRWDVPRQWKERAPSEKALDLLERLDKPRLLFALRDTHPVRALRAAHTLLARGEFPQRKEVEWRPTEGDPDDLAAWAFFTDASLPLAMRMDAAAYAPGVTQEARFARQTHMLSTGEYMQILRGVKKVDEEPAEEGYRYGVDSAWSDDDWDKNEEEGKWHHVEDEEDVGDPQALELGADGKPEDWERLALALAKVTPEVGHHMEEGITYFGGRVMMQYMDRPGLSRHDAVFAMKNIVKMARESGLTPEAFANNILLQVARDKAAYENGIAYHQLNNIAQEKMDASEMLQKARRYPALEELQKLVKDIESGEGIFSSWKTLKKVGELQRFLKKDSLLSELEGSAISNRLRTFIQKLAFHPNISMTSVVQFWKEPAKFLEIDDSHTSHEISASKKPSNYLSLPFLGLTGEDLRDAYVEGTLDVLQTLPPMERVYELREYDYVNPANARLLYVELRRGIGQARLGVKPEARDGKKLFAEVQKFCREQGVDWKALWEDQGVQTIAGLSDAQRTALDALVFNDDYGLRVKTVRYRVRLGKKSDPDMAVAGNDTASCMPFGSGKNNVYMFNPNCTQLVVEREIAADTWRTAAQSVMSIDLRTSATTPEVLAAYQRSEERLKDVLRPEDLLGTPVVTCDNIEVAKNAEGSASTYIRAAYERFFREYLGEHAQQLGVDATRVVVGTGYTPAELGLPSEDNHYVPLAPMGYSDNVHETCFVIETGLRPVGPVKQTGIAPMNTRDVLAVALLEGKAYHDNVSLLENLHGMQNNLIGKEIANQHFGRPNLSFVYRNDAGMSRGYMLAYEGRNGNKGEIYISDLATDKESELNEGAPSGIPESKIAGGRLIQAFFDAYTNNYGTAERPFLPIFTNARDQTSYRIIQAQTKRMAARKGLVAEMVDVQQYKRENDTFHDVRIFIGRTPEEIAVQKAEYAGLGRASAVARQSRDWDDE